MGRLALPVLKLLCVSSLHTTAGVVGGAVFLVVLHAVVLGLGVLMGLVLSGTLNHIKLMHGCVITRHATYPLSRLPRPTSS